jgi:hypothetical protein
VSGWTTDLKLAWIEIRRMRATAKALKWSTNLMNTQIALINALPADNPRKVEVEKQRLKQFMDLSTHVRAVAPKRIEVYR